MKFDPPLQSATLIKRYKRFLADIRLDDGREVTAHCANPGSMMGLADPDTRVWVEPNDDPRKKLKFGWRLVDHENGHFTGVDTSVPNRALRAALQAGEVAELAAYHTVRPEVKYGTNSRIERFTRNILFDEKLGGTIHLALGRQIIRLFLYPVLFQSILLFHTFLS